MAQIKKVLPIGRTSEKNDDSETKSASVEKAESSSIYSESIKSKEASIIEKGHGKHRKTMVLDFSEVNGTYFLPYEFRAVEIDKPRGQEQVAEKSRPTQIFYVIMHGIKKNMMKRHWGAIQRRSKILFKSHHHHALPTYLKRYV